jgi:hypothetical protein
MPCPLWQWLVSCALATVMASAVSDAVGLGGGCSVIKRARCVAAVRIVQRNREETWLPTLRTNVCENWNLETDCAWTRHSCYCVLLYKGFWVFTLLHYLVRDQRFGTACVSHHQGLSVIRRIFMQQDNRGESLQSHMLLCFLVQEHELYENSPSQLTEWTILGFCFGCRQGQRFFSTVSRTAQATTQPFAQWMAGIFPGG